MVPKLLVSCCAFVLVLGGCVTNPRVADKGGCKPEVEDFVNYVSGNKECLGIKVVSGVDRKDRRLLVYVHGDNPSGSNSDKPFDLLMGQVSRVPDLANLTKVAIARPSHNFSSGVSSSGFECKKEICYTENNFREIGAVVGRLKEHYKANAVILVGRSGGGNTVGSIAGLYPRLTDEVIGIAGNYDFDKWVRTSSIIKPHWTIHNSPSAKDYVGAVDKETRFTLVHGVNDTNNKRIISEQYKALLEGRGNAVELIDVQTGHFDQEGSPDLAPVLERVLSRVKALSLSRE